MKFSQFESVLSLGLVSLFLHALLDPRLGSGSLRLKLLLSLLPVLERLVRRGNVATSLEAGTLE